MHRQKKLVLFTATFLLTGNAWATDRPVAKSGKQLVAEARATVREIDIAQLSERLAEGALLIDVREPYEFDSGHIPEANHIPRGRLEFDIVDLPALVSLTPEEMRARPIVLYCRSGQRSVLAAESLERMGFTDVLSLRRGIKAWRESVAETETAGE